MFSYKLTDVKLCFYGPALSTAVQLAGAAVQPFVSVLAHHYTRLRVFHDQSILQLAVSADYGRMHLMRSTLRDCHTNGRILALEVTRVIISGNKGSGRRSTVVPLDCLVLSLCFQCSEFLRNLKAMSGS